MRHYRALHENKEETGASPSQATRKQELDEALKDTQPCSIVDDAGFRAFVSKLDPNYVPPTRRARGEGANRMLLRPWLRCRQLMRSGRSGWKRWRTTALNL
ncbi:uncharacterized protein AB9W97_005789 isoform 1-T1 [Spinachia spinachia]